MAKDKVFKKEKQKAENKAPKKAPENGVSKPSTNSGIWQDERFQHLVSDPRFKSLPKQQRKVKIDKRFQGMFTNDKFKVKYTVDKYGRRVNKSNAEDLKKYYELDSSAEESEEEVEKTEKESEEDNSNAGSSDEEEELEEREKEEKAITQQHSDADENDALESDGEDVPKTLRERLLDPNIDYARGEGRLVTDSSSDDESSEDEDPEMYIDHVWGELANDAESTEESTRRLAVCNMDWDRVRAVDLMVLFSSFLPPGGSVLSVKIYPSEFGKERLKEEELHGPPELVGLSKEAKQQKGSSKAQAEDDSSDDDSEEEDELVQEQDSDAGEGDDYHMEKLRQYQLNRLRYYYAVVECDSVATADKIYQECDGIEYESSATKVDLRYIPDDTSFDDDEPSDVCNELPDANSYQPRQFTTTALQQAKVDLTWDETAVDRKELGDKLSAGKLDGISDKDLRKIVAYSSEEEEDEEDSEEEEQESENEKEIKQDKNKSQENKEDKKVKEKPKKKSNKKEEVINKYKALLAEINEKEEKEKQKKKYEMEFSWEVNNDKTNPFKDDGVAEEETKKPQNLTPIEKVLLKRNEKNKKRKEERRKKKLQTTGQDSESELDSIPDDIDMDDPYFAEEFANGDFIDPKTKRREKQKKQQQLKAEQEQEDEKQAKELELLLDDNNEEDGKQHFSLDKILKSEQDTKSKKKRRKQLKKSKTAIEESQKPIEDNFQLNLDDQRFKAVFTSHEFNIDPTDSHFKKTKAMEQLIHEKLKRRHGDEKTENQTQNDKESDESASKKPKKHTETSMLVKSLKRKIQMKQQGK
ncbi:pre-rRNA-processing protein esf1 [Lucilia sericata]|uniref:pre-rRNA-processing protein esf1 n=1 Tax=Lucilia sericata TaxID=13632 RepID=UPI0018A81162|nr:pre-rRNA-processing protein esf1 [Lucilia sericata]